jgi:hypothetical protein
MKLEINVVKRKDAAIQICSWFLPHGTLNIAVGELLSMG